MRNFKDLRSEKGSATMVEFAIVSLVSLTFLLGILDFSRAVYGYHFISDAAREATRYAAVRGSTFTVACSDPSPVAYSCKAATTDIADYVKSIVSSGITATSTSASCSTPSANTINVCTTWPGTAPTGAAGVCNTANGDDSPGCLVQVKVLYTYGFSLPLVSKEVSSVTMTSTSSMVIQQ